MSKHPILFNDEMVRAILAGRKTMTRRVVKMHKDCHEDRDLRPTPNGLDLYYPDYPDEGRLGISCPYGQPSDRLWVRETFHDEGDGRIFYRADNDSRLSSFHGWRPSIHMPRELSRILLEITAVRVERVRDITVEDAKAEGMSGTHSLGDFRELWDSIYAERGYGWYANPWVWVVEFKRVV